MRRMRDMLGLIALLQLALAGCALTESEVKPPKPPEEFKAPPENDPRYSKPIEYPKETMDEDRLLKKARAAASGRGGRGLWPPASSGPWGGRGCANRWRRASPGRRRRRPP